MQPSTGVFKKKCVKVGWPRQTITSSFQTIDVFDMLHNRGEVCSVVHTILDGPLCSKICIPKQIDI